MIQESNSGSEELDLYSPGQASRKPDEQTNTESQDEVEEQQASYGYEIISEQQTNQVVVIKLKSDHQLWYKGHILFSSTSKNKGNAEDWRRGFLEGLGPTTGIRHLANNHKEMHYFVISREYPYNGKILMLNEDVYKQKFYINFDHLLSINYDTSECTISSHPIMKNLKLLNLKTSPSPPLFIALQSSKDTTIVQKYLDANEHMYLPNARVLALGQRVGCNWESKSRLMKFTGPGFVFFQPLTHSRNILSLKSREMILSNALLVIFIVLLYLVEWYFLK